MTASSIKNISSSISIYSMKYIASNFFLDVYNMHNAQRSTIDDIMFSLDDHFMISSVIKALFTAKQ